MSDSPYRLDTPAVVSFSGGRTSGYMLRMILDAFGGTLPDDVKVVFCNTGKERTQTLDFVERVSLEWDVPIVWLEYRNKGRHGFAVVNYATASRKGEPFDQIIANLGEFRRANDRPPVLPNPVHRFCTAELKIRTARRYLRSVGWSEWTDAIGLRADEPRRVARLKDSRERGERVAPMHAAGHSLDDVMAFWAAQPFDLNLRQHEGNCDLCFLKSAGKVAAIIRDRPESAEWWAAQEQATGQRFRKDRPDYAAMLAVVSAQPEFDWSGDESIEECRCTD